MKRLIIVLASVGFTGYFPAAPGTAGTVAGVLVYYLLSFFATPIYLFCLAAILITAWWVAGAAEAVFSEKDSPKIVIDEVVGYLISMAVLPRTLTTVIGGFLFFRILDIIKLPPANAADQRLRGGLGVVLDDVIAGIYTNCILRAVFHWRPDLLYLVDRRLFG